MFFRTFFRGMEGSYGQFLKDTAAAQARIESGESEVEEVLNPDGTRLRLAKAPDGGIHYSSDEGEVEVVGQRFPEAEERPSSYPVDAPFLPDVQVSVTEIPKNGWRSLAWLRVSDPALLAREIGKQLHEAGWIPGRVRRQLFGLLGVEKDFTKGGVTERLVLQKLPGGKKKLLLIRRSRGRPGPDSC